jgi:hypothetical protein
MHSVIGAVIFAAFIVGCLLGSSGKRQNPQEKTDNSGAQHKAADKKNNIAYWRQYIHSHFSHYKRTRNENRHHHNPNISWTRRTFLVIFFYTAATFALLFFTRESNQINRDAYTAVQRAFISVSGYRPKDAISDGEHHSWFFWPMIINDGNTRTRHISYISYIGERFIFDESDAQNPAMRNMWLETLNAHQGDPDDIFYVYSANLRLSVVVKPTEIPDGFNHAIPSSWVLNSIGPKESGLLWPGRAIWDTELSGIMSSRTERQIIGSVHYRDVFKDTDEHISKFCFIVIADRTKDGKITFKDGGLCSHWNCADEECIQDKKNYEQENEKTRRKILQSAH